MNYEINDNEKPHSRQKVPKIRFSRNDLPPPPSDLKKINEKLMYGKILLYYCVNTSKFKKY